MKEVELNFGYISGKSNQQHDDELRKRSQHLVKSKREIKKIAPIKLVLIGIIVIIVSSVMIYSRVVLTELTEDANSYQNKITKLNTEYERLSAELEAKTSIKAITEAAEKDLGLSKIDSSQIEYVRLTDSDDIEVEEKDNINVSSFFDDIFKKISELFL